MELRCCSQMHFITIIRGGAVIKVPNLARGNPKLKLKNIEEIYSIDSIWHDSLVECSKADRSLAMPFGFVEVKTEVKIEPIEEENELDFCAMTLRQIKDNCKYHNQKAARSIDLTIIKTEDENHRNEEDIFDFKDTLGSLKRKVLMKRKPKKKVVIKRNSVSSTTNYVDGRLKDSPANLDLLDVSSKICKPLNNKVEKALHDYSQRQARNLSYSIDPRNFASDSVKAIEHLCPDQIFDKFSVYPQSDNLVLSVASGSSNCDLNQISYEHQDCAVLQNPLISGNPDSNNTIMVENAVAVSYQPLASCVLEASIEEDMTDVMECDEPAEKGLLECDNQDCAVLQNPLISGNPDSNNTIMVENAVAVSYQPLASCVLEASIEEDMTDVMECDEPLEKGLLECDSSDILIDRPCYLQPSHDENPSSNVHVSVIAPNNDCQTAEIIYPGGSMQSMDENKDNEKVVERSAKNYNSEVEFVNNIPSNSSMASLDTSISRVEDQQWSLLGFTEEVPAPNIALKGFCHNTELITNGEANRSLDDNREPKAKAIRRDVKNFTVEVQDENNLPLVNSEDSLYSVKSGVEERQSLIPNDAITPLTRSPKPCIAVDQQIGSAVTEECCENKLEQQPPERLLSARKSISPNSKERLRRSLNCAEIQDNTHNLSSREKLFPEENCAVNSSSQSSFKRARITVASKRLEALHTTEIRSNSRQLKKGKYERKNSLIKGTVNGSRAFPLSASAVSVCSSQSCTKNAIAFSQQQMIDTERLASKLLSDVQSMKEMVVDTLTSSTSRHNTDKARIAVENAKKVEEATKKWLSMMSRDCARFCKIMELSETNGAPVSSNDEHITDSEICQNNLVSATKQDKHNLSPPESTVHKGKKIMFADEAGESLCQVEVL